MLDRIKEVEDGLDQSFIGLMRAQFAYLQSLFKPGLTLLNWTSLGIDQYVANVLSYVDQINLLGQRAHDLKAFRIEQVIIF